MGHLRNGSLFHGGPTRFAGGISYLTLDSTRFSQFGAHRNFWAGEATVISGASIANKNAFPVGYSHPTTWLLPPKPGGLASRDRAAGTGSISAANLAGGVNVSATLSGTGDLASTITALANLVASLTGTGTISDASGSAAAAIAATIAGTGAVSAANLAGAAGIGATLSGTGSVSDASIAGALDATATLSGTGSISDANATAAINGSATLSGTGTVSDANLAGGVNLGATLAGTGSVSAALTALGEIVATLTGSSSVSSANLNATGNISADISVAGAGDTLTAASIAAAVWDSVAASFDSSGTMGRLLNDAGAAAANKIELDYATGVLTVYAADGTTVRATFQMRDRNGDASSTEQMTREPT